MKLADLESIQKRLDKKNKKNISNEQIQLLETALNYINNDKNIDEISDLYEKRNRNERIIIFKTKLICL